MKLHEILQQPEVKAGDMWFRPVGLKRYAYCIQERNTELVPNPNGGRHHMTAQVEALIGDWELVTPNEVCDERN